MNDISQTLFAEESLKANNGLWVCFFFMQKENKAYLSQQEKVVCYTERCIIWNSSRSVCFWLLQCKPRGQRLQEQNNSSDSFLRKKNVSKENLIFINQLFLCSSSTGTRCVTVIILEIWLWNAVLSWTKSFLGK